jgi:hypothetical protein
VMAWEYFLCFKRAEGTPNVADMSVVKDGTPARSQAGFSGRHYVHRAHERFGRFVRIEDAGSGDMSDSQAQTSRPSASRCQ